jgi:uncharacterized protein (DUF2235 family)
MSASKQPGTNIVLLSDGTGNSSAKLMKTNVWRTYEGLDTTAGDQIAIYDNGVGTSSFKPLAVIGGALGWGLKRNVRSLYTFACRHYRPESDAREADKLFAFGFSRGAYTARVLIGLIESQGLITGASGQELERRAKWAYREYRKQFNATRGLVTPLRWLRDVCLRAWEGLRGGKPYDKRDNTPVRVAFLGLWDTVDAYGLPVDEMTRGWDDWVWPLSMGAKIPPRNVDRICHAVSLDDERHTFHPVLLDESCLEPRDRDRVTQVWFAGAHANVGGGYPDDSLARIPLLWMTGEAEKCGLRFHDFVRAEWKAHSDPNGRSNDSRTGAGVYYRYNPRSIKRLTDDRFADVKIPVPKIHESVFARIKQGRDDYAPIVLPETYAVMLDDGTVVDGQANPFESPSQALSRCRDQERAWNMVFIRRGLYFSTVFLTLLLVVPPFIREPQSPIFSPSPDWRWSRAVIDAVKGFLPDMAAPVVSYYQANNGQFAVLGILLIVLLRTSTVVQRQIRDRMRRIWEAIADRGAADVTPSPPPGGLLFLLRSNYAYRWTVEQISYKIFPLLFGVAALAVVVLSVVGTLNRAWFAFEGALGTVCVDTQPVAPNVNGEWSVAGFTNAERCFATGIEVEAGRHYQIEFTLPEGGWCDNTLRVQSTAGFSSGGPVFVAALPFRRVLMSKWFVPMARIGDTLGEYHDLSPGVVSITPRMSGQLFLFVNDAIGVGPYESWFYRNNNGRPAAVKVRKLAAPGTTADRPESIVFRDDVFCKPPGTS